jgi:HAD superfamily hydrolase (TIGR01549 family)
MIETVVFDVGEVLIDETRMRQGYARVLDVSMSMLLTTLRQVIERREHHHRVVAILRPDMAVDEFRRRIRALSTAPFDATDLYPDAAPCLAGLKRRGFRVGIAGNQWAEAEQTLASFDLGVDFIASSTSWGIEKPDPEFFVRVAAAANCPAERIAYVGDRLDNDVLPARAAGMFAVFLRRGPWGEVHATWPAVAQAHLRLENLAELPDALRSS